MKKSLQPMMSSVKTDWETPDDLFKKLNAFYRFTVDVAANELNSKLPRWFGFGGERECGLSADWAGERVWINPPYGRVETAMWVERAARGDADIAVLLLPSRTSNKWFHDYLWRKKGVEIEFIKGRLKFGNALHCAPFPSMIAIIQRRICDN